MKTARSGGVGAAHPAAAKATAAKATAIAAAVKIGGAAKRGEIGVMGPRRLLRNSLRVNRNCAILSYQSALSAFGWFRLRRWMRRHPKSNRTYQSQSV